MLILLPPSEGKAEPPSRGMALDPGALSFPQLAPVRRTVLDALVEASRPDDAARRLGFGASLALEVRRNVHLADLPTRAAVETYTGVLYDALDWAGLDGAARRRAGSRLVIASALWGLLRPKDRIPAYRLTMDTTLPGLAPLAQTWRPVLAPALGEAAGRRGAVVDCRSTSYAAAAPLGGPQAERTVAVRVLREVEGRRSVVSHMAKHTRGLVARALLTDGADPRGPGEVAEALAGRWHVELRPAQRAGRPWTLDVVVPDHSR